jgi:hypothetical protein
MQMPLVLYGSSNDVKRTSTTIAMAWSNGQRLDEVAGPLIDSRACSGYHVLDAPGPGGHHFFLNHLMVELGKRLQSQSQPHLIQRELEVLQDAARTPWGTLMLLANANAGWWMLRARPQLDRLPILIDAVRQHWDVLDGEGARYVCSVPPPSRLWDASTNLKYALAALGVPAERLRGPLPDGGPTALLPR